MNTKRLLFIAIGLVFTARPIAAQRPDLDRLLAEVTANVESNQKLAQVAVDKIFSFAELGFHETETSKYLTGILQQNGFRIRTGISGIPTAWWAEWGQGKPVIALGSDIDALPQTSQKPGVAYRAPLIEGAPGHGEGHNSGQALNLVAALALKKIMERERIPGTIVLWPGVAEELVAAKAWFVRDGMFKNVDAVIFTHVSSNLNVAWGQPSGTGLVSVEFEFTGESAHGAGSPWRGRSALDAVELMNIGWNYRREHLRPEQRSHYVITNGGDQPNVVPPNAAVWYYFREMNYDNIKRNFDTGIRIAEAAAKMTDTEMKYRILGTAWPRHFNKTLAEVTHKHIRAVGLPTWSNEDLLLARSVQRELRVDTVGLTMRIDTSLSPPSRNPSSGGSDDIGDVSWVVPTITLGYPSNIPGATAHHWSSAIAMATPIAHKGVVAGAKVLARSALELFVTPSLIDDAWKYFRNVQTANTKYTPFIGPNDPPPTFLNQRIMEAYRPQMRQFYYDETKFDSYLQQLGITYPTIRR